MLFLNKIGVGEIVLILLLIALFFGANNIPNLARSIGKSVRKVNNLQQNSKVFKEQDWKQKLAIDKVIQEILEINVKH